MSFTKFKIFLICTLVNSSWPKDAMCTVGKYFTVPYYVNWSFFLITSTSAFWFLYNPHTKEEIVRLTVACYYPHYSFCVDRLSLFLQDPLEKIWIVCPRDFFQWSWCHCLSCVWVLCFDSSCVILQNGLGAIKNFFLPFFARRLASRFPATSISYNP